MYSKTRNTITEQSDSLIDLLVGQCSDLESLLKLARQEATAAENDDFDGLLRIVSERATLGERLESYHRQIADLRRSMGASAEGVIKSNLAEESVRLALAIQGQDSNNKQLLRATHAKQQEAIVRLENGRRSSVAYLSEGRLGGLNCDRRA
jgi:flagellar biosynthesis/type III secretory pathway chaperone